MRKLLVFVLFVFLTQTTLAETNAFIPKQLSIRVDFNYQDEQKGHVNRYVLNDEIQMKSNNPQWTIIQEQEPSSQNNPIILLSKIEKWDSEKVTIAFLVLDTDKNPKIISKPKLVVFYGQKGQITIKERNNKIGLVVLINVIKAT